MNRYRNLHGALALGSLVLFPAMASAVSPSAGVQPLSPLLLIELQDFTGGAFKPSGAGGMEITSLNPAGNLAGAGLEVGDTILSINGARTTDMPSLIGALEAARGKLAEVVTIDRRTGQIVTLKVGL